LSFPLVMVLPRENGMDLEAVEQLRRAGIKLDPAKSPLVVPTQVDDDERLVALGENEVPFAVGEKVVLLRLKPVTALFTGNVRPPSFLKGPTSEYVTFFATIERAVTDAASFKRPIPSDDEFQRLYRLLKRHPDGRDQNPLFSYMQAAARAYMSLVDVSREEFEAVVSRIALTAKHFSAGPSTTNYFEMLSHMFLGNRDPVLELPGGMTVHPLAENAVHE
jgi:hypothetical protein